MIFRFKKSGFTLIEILIVVFIIALLSSIVYTNYIKVIDKKKIDNCKLEMERLKVALEHFYADNNSYPSKRQGLEILIGYDNLSIDKKKKKYLNEDKLPLDPWGNEFIYIPIDDGKKGYILKSYGSDGKEGGKGTAKDIIFKEIIEF